MEDFRKTNKQGDKYNTSIKSTMKSLCSLVSVIFITEATINVANKMFTQIITNLIKRKKPLITSSTTNTHDDILLKKVLPPKHSR